MLQFSGTIIPFLMGNGKISQAPPNRIIETKAATTAFLLVRDKINPPDLYNDPFAPVNTTTIALCSALEITNLPSVVRSPFLNQYFTSELILDLFCA